MHSHQSRFATHSSYEDYRLGMTIGTVIAAYAGFFLVLYWLMQPTVSANAGLAACRRAVGPSGPVGSTALPPYLGRAAARREGERDRGAEERGQEAGKTDSASTGGAPRSTATKSVLGGLWVVPSIRWSLLVLVAARQGLGRGGAAFSAGAH
jgi:hypothetical protein